MPYQQRKKPGGTREEVCWDASVTCCLDSVTPWLTLSSSHLSLSSFSIALWNGGIRQRTNYNAPTSYPSPRHPRLPSHQSMALQCRPIDPHALSVGMRGRIPPAHHLVTSSAILVSSTTCPNITSVLSHIYRAMWSNCARYTKTKLILRSSQFSVVRQRSCLVLCRWSCYGHTLPCHAMPCCVVLCSSTLYYMQ